MAEMIMDGDGGTKRVGVTEENQLKISGPMVTKEHYTNFRFEDAYNAIYDVTPTGAGDVFLYIKNTNSLPIVSEGFNIRCASDEIIQVSLGVVGTPVGGSDIIPANLTSGSKKQAIGEFKTGNDITGLTNGTVIGDFYIAGSNESKFRNFDADIIIPQNQTLVFSVLTGGIEINGFLVMWHDHGGN